MRKQIPNMTPNHRPSWLVNRGLRSLEGNAFMDERLGSEGPDSALETDMSGLRKSDGLPAPDTPNAPRWRGPNSRER